MLLLGTEAPKLVISVQLYKGYLALFWRGLVTVWPGLVIAWSGLVMAWPGPVALFLRGQVPF